MDLGLASKMIIVIKLGFILCSGYLRKETPVISIVLPFVYRGLDHFAVHSKNSHLKKEEILRWTAKKRKNS